MGNILTKSDVHRITLKQHGVSTLGGRKVWFDSDILRLNYDEHGKYLGEFQSEDLILVVQEDGTFYTTNFDVNNHYDPGIRVIEKFNPNKIWSAILYDADQNNYPYLKRFPFEESSKRQSYLGGNEKSKLILLTDTVYPRFEVKFGGRDDFRDPLIIEADEFIGVKSFKAKGKRITTFTVDQVVELEPTRQPEPEEEVVEEKTMPIVDPDEGKSEDDIKDEITGQLKLF